VPKTGIREHGLHPSVVDRLNKPGRLKQITLIVTMLASIIGGALGIISFIKENVQAEAGFMAHDKDIQEMSNDIRKLSENMITLQQAIIAGGHHGEGGSDRALPRPSPPSTSPPRARPPQKPALKGLPPLRKRKQRHWKDLTLQQHKR